MIYLITGLPGNGKTLYTVARAPELLAHPGRTIYYAGINELTLDWSPTDPETWYSLPNGSAIVIDEAQKYFRPLPNGAERPRKITAMETHRHAGMDIWLITQHPNLLDPHVRRLVGKHIHVHRTHGFGFANVWEWEQVEDPNDYHAKQKAVTSRFKFPAEVFHKYKSAEVHTVKRRIPFKLMLLPVAAIAVAGLAWFGYSTLKGSAKPKGEDTTRANTGQGLKIPASQLKPISDVDRAVAYLEQRQPLHTDLPYTAPRYERFTEVKAMPIVRGCFSDRRFIPPTCWCVSQRGTKMDVSREFCENFIAHGRPFNDFEPDEPVGSQAHSSGVVVPQIERPAAGPSEGLATPKPVLPF